MICVTKSSNGNCSVLWLLQSLEVWGHGDTASASETGVERLLYPFTPLIYELKKELSIRTEERKRSIDYVKNGPRYRAVSSKGDFPILFCGIITVLNKGLK